MPPILIVVLVAGVGFLLYERFIKPGAPGTLPGPQPPVISPTKCLAATSITAGRQYRFAMIPVGKGDSQTTPAQVAALVSTGNIWVGVQAWTSVDPSVPAYSWPPGAQPGPGVFLVQAVYAGPDSAVPSGPLVQGMLDCGPAKTLSTEGGTASGPSGSPGFHLTPPIVYQGNQPAPAPVQPAPAPAAPGSIPLHIHGMAAFAIAQAAETQLAALGPQPSGMLTSLQWQIAQASLQYLDQHPTVDNLRSTVQSLSQPSQGPYANNAAAGLQPLLTQFGG